MLPELSLGRQRASGLYCRERQRTWSYAGQIVDWAQDEARSAGQAGVEVAPDALAEAVIAVRSYLLHLARASRRGGAAILGAGYEGRTDEAHEHGGW